MAAPKLDKVIVNSDYKGDPVEKSLIEIADDYGSLLKKRNELLSDPVFLRFEETERLLKARLMRDFRPDCLIEIRGSKWTLTIGPATKVARQITSILAVFKMLGQKTFMKLAKISLGDLQRYLTPEQLDAVLTQPDEYTDRRDIKAKARK